MGASLWLCRIASAADPEGRAVPLDGSLPAGAGGFPWIAAVVTVVAVAVVVWMRWKGRSPAAGSLGGIRIISRTPMGRGRALSLVQVGDHVVLVGESSQGFQRLAEFESEESVGEADSRRRVAG